ncbi:Phosphoribosyl 1,2-cyclic phosphodiesterase [Clostridium sp. USBA 49]|uniref:MBL fold metallo-hydrolase n=1 Tax=Clostridium TaxID=1485 RepID=UPI0009995E2A|nr:MULTISPECIES: MBL fold metallo-hydrolase [Clostridium]SKA88924.1 Phosphoribosyl 1,2-cyclic phosphodiesterase [Clostridium sp. USBA 49]
MIFCSLYSGSSGNSIFVSSENAKILIDAGLPGKNIEKALKDINENPSEIDGIFVTHEHSDHVKGVGVLSRKYDIPIYANEFTWKAMEGSIGKIKEHNIKIMNSGCLSIKDMDIVSFKIPHDAASPQGYAVYNKNKKAAIATDIGHFSDEIKKNIVDSDVVLIESNHDVEMLKFGPYPYTLKRRILSNIGHLSNEDCAKAIVDIIGQKRKRVILGHLSKTNNYPELAYQTVVSFLKQMNVELNKDIGLTVAKRDMPSNYIKF